MGLSLGFFGHPPPPTRPPPMARRRGGPVPAHWRPRSKSTKRWGRAEAWRLAELLPALAERHELLIIDTAGFGNQAATVAAAGADLVLVPVTPGEGDLIGRPVRQEGFDFVTSPAAFAPISLMPVAFRVPSAWR
jgi:hypothetical protein